MRSEKRSVQSPKVLTCLPPEAAVGNGECDRGFEAVQHQKPKLKMFTRGIKSVEKE